MFPSGSGFEKGQAFVTERNSGLGSTISVMAYLVEQGDRQLRSVRPMQSPVRLAGPRYAGRRSDPIVERR